VDLCSVTLVSNLRLLIFMGRVDYLVQDLSACLAGPGNIATYALNRLAAGESERGENQGYYEKGFFKHLFRLHNNT
jgi:hypothetical protein